MGTLYPPAMTAGRPDATRDWNLIRLRPRCDTIYVSNGRTVLATGTDGFLSGQPDQGLFVHETRLLSHYRFRIEGKPLYPVSSSNVVQRTWLGYYIAPASSNEQKNRALFNVNAAAQHSIELRLSRTVGDGLHEDVDLTNFTQTTVRFDLAIELDCDFADLIETHDERQQRGTTSYGWSKQGEIWEWRADYEAVHRYSYRDEKGEATLQRGIAVRFSDAGSAPRHNGGRISFEVMLLPHASWHCCVDHVPIMEGRELRSACRCESFSDREKEEGRRTQLYLSEATRFSNSHTGTLANVVAGSLEQGKYDLADLRLFDLDEDARTWTVAAGLPLYVALFGRDTLTASWEAAPVTTDLMRGTLAILARYQGKRKDDWRDEEPGRMLHEAHTGPTGVLNYHPRGRDYGSITTSGFYPFVLAQLWHWTGDKSLVGPLVEPALAAIKWLDERSSGKDGFSTYKTHSEQGVQNQGWKDSGDAIVYEDGSQVPKPVATCEEQGIKYAAKMNFAEVLWYLDRKDEAKEMYQRARELKKRFNDAFWMEDEGFFAMALDPDRRQVRSIGSNALHCIATGIADRALVKRTFERLFQPDMLSGWGVRTLSAEHPAYNPYAYHRGTVWPVEHGPFAVGAYRYGCHEYVERIARAQFELAAMFDFYRLPECIAGHQRDRQHPFPAVYPAANSPQAWSATTVYTLVQAILGMQPFAPLRILFVDPVLPVWLPELTISGMRVARATVSIRFFRTANGRSDYEILDCKGKLRVIRQPSPWSFTAGLGERARDLIASALH